MRTSINQSPSSRRTPKSHGTRSRFKWILVAVTAVALAGLLGACGGSGKRLSAHGGVSESSFIAQAEGITCPVQAELEAVPKPSGITEVETYTQQAAAILQRTKSKLEAIGVPADRQATFSRGLSLIGTAASKVGELGQAAEEGNTQRVQVLNNQIDGLDSKVAAVDSELSGSECPSGTGASSASPSQETTGDDSTTTTQESTGDGASTAPSPSSADATPVGAWSAPQTHGLEMLLESDPNRACVVRYVEERMTPPGSSQKAEELAKSSAATCGGSGGEEQRGAPAEEASQGEAVTEQ